MSEHFNWRENQLPGAGFVINPGTGPVHNSSHAQARANIEQYVRDVLDHSDGHHKIEIVDLNSEHEGRYTYRLLSEGRVSEVDMPGIPLEHVRYMKEPEQDIWDYPRLYENGSPWVWFYAIDLSVDHLFGVEENEL